MDTNQKCWEYMNCGKEEECPAYPNHGHSCFSVTATVCRGSVQGTYDEKAGACRNGCKFYKQMFGS